MHTFTPSIYWAQTSSEISIKVDLINAKDINVKLIENELKFSAEGRGTRGTNIYEFTVNFYSEIDFENSNYKVLDRHVEFSLRKKYEMWWPRLISQPQKPSWIQIDFDKWKFMDETVANEPARDICQDYPNLYDQVHHEEFGYRKEDYKKVYLIFCNLFQFIGFFSILSIMAIRYYRDGLDSTKDTYNTVGNMMNFIQLFQYLEFMHGLFGYTKSDPLMTFLQVSDRSFILFCMINGEPRMQTKPVVFYIFLIWIISEIVRYPYYISQLFNFEIGFLKWLRYSSWILLYPLGFICEGVIVLRNIPYFEETETFTVNLPNSWNFSFHCPTFMRIYLLLICIPGTFMIMSYMNNNSRKKLSSNHSYKIKRKL